MRNTSGRVTGAGPESKSGPVGCGTVGRAGRSAEESLMRLAFAALALGLLVGALL